MATAEQFIRISSELEKLGFKKDLDSTIILPTKENPTLYVFTLKRNKQTGEPDIIRVLYWAKSDHVEIAQITDLTQIQPLDIVTAGGWVREEMQKFANEYFCVLSPQQAEYILAEHKGKFDKAKSEFGNSGVREVAYDIIMDVQTCAHSGCNNAINVGSDDEHDVAFMLEEGGAVCFNCKFTDPYRACFVCDYYSPQADMVEIPRESGSEFRHHDCTDPMMEVTMEEAKTLVDNYREKTRVLREGSNEK